MRAHAKHATGKGKAACPTTITRETAAELVAWAQQRWKDRIAKMVERTRRAVLEEADIADAVDDARDDPGSTALTRQHEHPVDGDASGADLVDIGDDGFGWVSSIFGKHNKRFKDYAKADKAKVYRALVAKELGIGDPETLVVKREAPFGGVEPGWWVHPQIVTHALAFISPEFERLGHTILFRYFTGRITTAESRNSASALAQVLGLQPTADVGALLDCARERVVATHLAATRASAAYVDAREEVHKAHRAHKRAEMNARTKMTTLMRYGQTEDMFEYA